jgi:hypothetical protein
MLPQGTPLAVEVLHRGIFGQDGDGIVLVAISATETYVLRPRDEGTRRVHAASCSGSGGSRTCLAEADLAGVQGLSRESISGGWRTSTFDLPAAFNAGGSMTLRFMGMNHGPTASALYQIARVEVVVNEDGGARTDSEWTTIHTVDTSCAGVTVLAPFVCTTSSPVAGASGAVLRYYNAPKTTSAGQATFPIALSSLGGRQVSALVRHRVDFTAGTLVGSAYGRMRVCCGGTCSIAHPVDQYPASAPGMGDSFSDEGPDALIWMVDEFDLTPWAGLTSCTLMLKGQGAVTSTQLGWLVDSVVVRWR